ncbi:MAG: penicillin-binding protein activator [Methylococcales bacterium]|nr:penicillin-binding protein activator [Methylococcales bacterium]
MRVKYRAWPAQSAWCAALMLMLAGCSTPPTWTRTARQAEQLLQQNQPAEAAKLYGKLAQDSDTDSLNAQFRLLTIGALLKAGQPEAAKIHADGLAPSQLATALRDRLNLYYAQIHLGQGEAELALERLQSLTPEHLSRTDFSEYVQALAFAQSLAGQLADSVSTRIQANARLSGDSRYANQLEILTTLQLLTAHGQALPPDTQSWVGLLTALQAQSEAPLTQWRQAHPKHPANQSGFLQTYLSLKRDRFRKPEILAVLLPHSGPFQSAADAIREGLLTAFHQDTNPAKPELKFYDTEGGQGIATLYQRAVADNAQFVIGPLAKNQIATLVAQLPLTRPILALNTLDDVNQAKLYQFGLDPQDAMQTVIDQAWSQGRQNALALLPDTPQGERLLGYLQQALSHHDGQLLAAQRYPPGQFDYRPTLAALLDITTSEQRIARLKQTLPKLQAEPRPRRDADFIFIHADAHDARALIQQLAFYGSQLPIYSDSQLHTRTLDNSLNSVIFCDAPWLIPKAYPTGGAIDTSQSGKPYLYLRLVAMGIDAYQLAQAMPGLNQHRLSGTSGQLTLDARQHIKRQLSCAQIQNGQPVLLNSNEHSYESMAQPAN